MEELALWPRLWSGLTSLYLLDTFPPPPWIYSTWQKLEVSSLVGDCEHPLPCAFPPTPAARLINPPLGRPSIIISETLAQEVGQVGL